MTNKTAIIEELERLININDYWKSAFVNGVPIDLLRSVEALLKTFLSNNEINWTLITSENDLPNDDESVLITIKDESGDTPYIYSYVGWYLKTGKCWIVDNEARNDIIAWAKFPCPYERKK